MDKSKLKGFAIWARRELIKDVTYKAGLIGITENEIREPVYKTNELQMFDIGTNDPYTIKGEEIKQRNSLVTKIKEKGFNQVVEEIAYTWFNRIIAIRYMEVNDYLPTKVRVLSSETAGKDEPDMVTVAPNIEFAFTDNEKFELIPTLKHENKLDELFKLLFIKQCNELNKILPELFEKTNDYSELLLDISFTNEDSVIRKLVVEISEDNYNDQVEIIGWLYQYYNEERKNEVINIYKGTVKKNDIPAATQLFTTDWVVRYMVDNSLGKYWLERNPNSNLRNKLDYLVHKDIVNIDEPIEPKDLKVLDPCMGSGHILVYAFDVLMAIYEESGYSQREAAKSIIENNLYGIDIDDRAFQLAYFAVMMKGRSYNRRILNDELEINVCAIQESSGLKSFENGSEQLSLNQMHIETANYLIDLFKDAKELGSLIQVEKRDYEGLSNYINELITNGADDIFTTTWLMNIQNIMPVLIKQAQILSEKYDAVVTNPPYLNKMEDRMKIFINKEYKDYSADLFSIFIYRNFGFCKFSGYSAFMTPFVWMFIKTYQRLREYIIDKKNMSSLIQMEYSAFEEATVPICTFVLKNDKKSDVGVFIRLAEFKGGMEIQRQKVLEAINDTKCDYIYEVKQEKFPLIPSSPIAFWIKNYNVFSSEQLGDGYESGGRNKTHNNETYVRNWWEVENHIKWQPYANGGEYRKWYGNHSDVVDWSEEAKQEYSKHGGLYNQRFAGKQGICWNLITSYKNGFRIKLANYHYSSGSPTIISEDEEKDLIRLGFLNTNLASYLLKMMNPTLNTTVSDVMKLPFEIKGAKKQVVYLVKSCIQIANDDWDDFEESIDFRRHPLLNSITIHDSFCEWKRITEERFYALKSNEEILNHIFIRNFEMQDEVSESVDEKDITIRKSNLRSDIKSFISYAVGCMLGRYNLDIDGLAYAGGVWNASNYVSFTPDRDNCIPITDEEYFEDDIVGRFVEFVRVVYGQETLKENLDFIANALAGKGDTSREIIRSYLIKDFFKDHLKTYQKRPIYWQFDSGKENGFKALIYMHRYNEDTVGTVRTEYLHKLQKVYESEIDRMDLVNESSSNATEKARAIKRKEKLTKQLNETNAYDAALSHIALQRIPIDLDDGVKVNYAKFQEIEVSKGDGKKAVKVDLLSKI